jgi:alpha-beta hydrolase superfamily lysophospholipase
MDTCPPLLNPHALTATVELPDSRGTYTLTGLRRRDCPPDQVKRVAIYVAGLGGCFAWAEPFWQDVLDQGVLDAVIGLDLRSFGVNRDLLDNGKPCVALDACLHDLRALGQSGVLEKALGFHHVETRVWTAISLGAMASCHILPDIQGHYDGVALFVPAFKANPKTYPLGYILKATLAFSKARLYKQLDVILDLPYGIDAVTRNPEVRAHHVATQGQGPLTQHLGFMLSILPWQQRSAMHLKKLNVPVLMVTAGHDLICDTPTMHRAFKTLPAHVHHLQAHFPMLYHDVLLEPERVDVVDAFCLWIKRLKKA